MLQFWAIVSAIASNKCRHECVVHFFIVYALIIIIAIHFAEIRLLGLNTAIWIVSLIFLALPNLLIILRLTIFRIVILQGGRARILNWIVCYNVIILKEFWTLSALRWYLCFILCDYGRDHFVFSIVIHRFNLLVWFYLGIGI